MRSGDENAMPFQPQSGGDYQPEWGMTLREHYTGIAAQGLAANPAMHQRAVDENRTSGELAAAIACGAVEIADAIISKLNEVKK